MEAQYKGPFHVLCSRTWTRREGKTTKSKRYLYQRRFLEDDEDKNDGLVLYYCDASNEELRRTPAVKVFPVLRSNPRDTISIKQRLKFREIPAKCRRNFAKIGLPARLSPFLVSGHFLVEISPKFRRNLAEISSKSRQRHVVKCRWFQV